MVAYSPTRENLLKFVDEISSEVEADVVAADSAEAAISGADVVLCATNSVQPVFDGTLVQKGQHLGCIKNCELDDNAFKRVDRLVIHAKDSSPKHLVMKGVDSGGDSEVEGWKDDHGGIDWNSAPTISQLVSGSVQGRGSEDEVTCFANNLGLGVQFAAVGAKLIEIAREKGVGHELPTEWFTQTVHP